MNTCQECGKPFTPVRSWQRYCSTTCRIKTWNRQNPGTVEPVQREIGYRRAYSHGVSHAVQALEWLLNDKHKPWDAYNALADWHNKVLGWRHEVIRQAGERVEPPQFSLPKKGSKTRPKTTRSRGVS